MSAQDILANTLSSDFATRQEATQALENASTQNYPEYMSTLSTVLLDESTPTHVRTAGGLALKNALKAKSRKQESPRQLSYTHRWLALDPNIRSGVKQNSLNALASASHKVGAIAAQVVSAIAAVELPQGEWPELIQNLLQSADYNVHNVTLRVAALQTIGYMCESIDPDLLSSRSNEILTVVVSGARKEEVSSDVQVAAMHALCNSLEFVKQNFEREVERSYLMQVICEATQNSNPAIEVLAFECLVKIMGLYYDKMEVYMHQALFGLTVAGMKNMDERVAIQAVEFWSTVCDVEIDLAMEAEEAEEEDQQPLHESKHFAKMALPEIIPVLLLLLTKQKEHAEEDEWNISTAASTCLTLLSEVVKDTILPLVMPFIEAHIRHQDWRLREAAITCLSSVLEGPNPAILAPLAEQALPVLIEMMQDRNEDVRKTSALTLARICDPGLLIGVVDSEMHLNTLATALVRGLEDTPRVAIQCCWALMYLADDMCGEHSKEEQLEAAVRGERLSPYYDGVVDALLTVTGRSAHEMTLRMAAYEALHAMLQRATRDSYPAVQHVLVIVLDRMETLLNILDRTEDRRDWDDHQSTLCYVVSRIIRTLNAEILPFADRIMVISLRSIDSAKASLVSVNTFRVVGGLAGVLGEKFLPYSTAAFPYIFSALRESSDAHLAQSAIEVFRDICSALGKEIGQFSGAFVNVMLEHLQSESLEKKAKLNFLTCLTNLAGVIGPQFDVYLRTIASALKETAEVAKNPQDYEEYLGIVINLRKNVLAPAVTLV